MVQAPFRPHPPAHAGHPCVLPARHLRGLLHAPTSHHALVRTEEAEVLELPRRYDSLSRRERQVMTQVVSGRLNKQAVGALGISEITVKAHRGKVMRKTGADSLAELVTMAIKLRLPPVPSGWPPPSPSPHELPYERLTSHCVARSAVP